MIRFTLSLWLALWVIPVPVGAQGTIRFEKSADLYEFAVLKLILDKTKATDGPSVLTPENLEVSEDRAIELLNQGKLEVACMVLSRQRETRVLPIRIDITAGVQGIRVFLVRKDRLSEFSRVRTLRELTDRFVAGFGSQWGDLPVMQRNGFRLETDANSRNLYPMLQAGRFDFFPRGINEVWDNLRQHAADAPDMVVEPTLALYYPLVQCFLVGLSNTALADRLTRGLRSALADGSLRDLFFQFYGDDVRRAHLRSRTILNLENPDLPVGGPQPDPSWWRSLP